MLRIFNNKGIKLTAKTVDEDIEKAGVASRNIVMTKAIHVVLMSFVFGQEVFGLPVLVIFKAPKFAKGFFGVNFWSREFFGYYWLSYGFFLVQLSLIQLIQFKRGYNFNMCNYTYPIHHVPTTAGKDTADLLIENRKTFLYTRFTQRVLGITRKNDTQITGYHSPP